ncbi:MFS transporter [Vandammella animalimorsus]|uniref:MFS transporter n=2 Tax=Vandammella animalimorsus TaxID=2029117 RepID=A0A2A2AMF6_9BURK|nr:MFS transporter [Vandammella animalimorsus]
MCATASDDPGSSAMTLRASDAPPAARSAWLLFATLYASQYLGIGFIGLALAAVLREQGASLAQLGLLNLLLLPMSLKFLWAPLVDRHGRRSHGTGRWPGRGHYRNWLLPMQALMALMLALAAFMPPQGGLQALLLAALLVYAVATATQDLALDGMATLTFAPAQRPLINSIQVGAGMLGNIVGGALVLWLYPTIGWRGCLWLLAALVVFPWLLLWAWREPQPPTDTVNAQAGRSPWRQLLTFWQGQLPWLALVALGATAFAALAMLTPALVDAGWELPQIGSAIRLFGAVVGLLAALLAAWWLRRLGRAQAIALSALLQALALLALLPVLLGRSSPAWVHAAIAAYYLAFSPLYASLGTVMMDKARATGAPATLYTLQNATAMLLALLGSSACLWLAQRIGYAGALLLCMGCLLLAAMLALRWPGITATDGACGQPAPACQHDCTALP